MVGGGKRYDASRYIEFAYLWFIVIYSYWYAIYCLTSSLFRIQKTFFWCLRFFASTQNGKKLLSFIRFLTLWHKVVYFSIFHFMYCEGLVFVSCMRVQRNSRRSYWWKTERFDLQTEKNVWKVRKLGVVEFWYTWFVTIFWIPKHCIYWKTG